MKYKSENFENEDHKPLDEFFRNPVLTKMNELAKEGWKVVSVIPWEIEKFDEYLIIFER